MSMEFRFFECFGETLFQPMNDEAKNLVRGMNKQRKNLTEREFVHYLNLIKLKKEDIILSPRIMFNKEIFDMVTYDGNRFYESADA